ncbi:TMV resistance protein N [Lactuca sativa]|nr:TMV resistance protein N [Lactuca sativa]
MRNLRYIRWKGDIANPLLKKLSPWEFFLWYIQWKGEPANPLLKQFPPKELCCLILRDAMQQQLWNGCKVLPNLKIMELYDLNNLIMTPNFDGIPYLERFKLWRCEKLEEIHSSFGRLNKLVCLSIVLCKRIKKFPSITRLKKLKTLSLHVSPEVIELSEIQEKMDNLIGEEDISSAVCELSNSNHIRLCFFRKDLKELDLSWCNLGDEDISSAVWELPNMQKLNLSKNKFSRLNFNFMRTPRLKLLNVSFCTDLVELSELPSSIAVVEANGCPSLKSFGAISNCKWLWKFSLRGVYNLDPFVGYMLLDSMLKGHAIEDHLISVILDYEIPKEYVFVGRLFRGNTFRLRLPHDWHNDFSGFLIHVVTHDGCPNIKITIKEEKLDEDLPFRFWHESNYNAMDRCRIISTYVGYVSFNSLRLTACLNLNSLYSVISISLRQSWSNASPAANRIGVSLVPKTKHKGDPMKTAKDSSEFGDEKDKSSPIFAIKHGSKSSIKILWRPLN